MGALPTEWYVLRWTAITQQKLKKPQRWWLSYSSLLWRPKEHHSDGGTDHSVIVGSFKQFLAFYTNCLTIL